MRRSATCALSLAVLVAETAAPASADDWMQRRMLAGGAWPAGRLVPCAAGRVTFVGPRLAEPPHLPPADRFRSGVGVAFSLPSNPRFFNGVAFATARVVHYAGDLGNALMQRENAGDRVQVCLVSFPNPLRDPRTKATICNPNDDPRGMVFRIYDYARRAAYIGPDSQHSCGGA